MAIIPATSSIALFLITVTEQMSTIEKQQYRDAMEISFSPSDVPPPAFGVLTVAEAGISGSLSRGDHKHKLLTAAPVDIGSANAEGVSTFLARADHGHNHGTQTDPSQHAVVTTTTAGFMSAADKVNLDGLVVTGGVPTSRLLNTVAPLLINGGSSADLSADRTFSMPAATTSVDGYMTAALATLATNATPNTRQIIAGAGLTGGGTFAADRTINVGANGDGSIIVNANDIGVGVLASDGQHGVRGGGTQHAAVIAAGASGFMTGADKSILDGLSTRAINTTAPLTGGGDLSADRTLAISAATTIAAGSMSAADKTKLDTVATNAIDAAGVFTALAAAAIDVSINSHKLTNVAAPTLAGDAVNKSYADALAQGLKAKDSVHVIAVTPITLSGLQTVDGHALGVGHPVLVAGQGGSLTTPHVDNGIYLAQTGAWTRRSDFNTGAAVGGSTTFTTEGTTYDDTGWVCTNAIGSDIVGTNALGFTQFSSSIALATVAPVNVTKAAASIGASAKAAREDHKHDITTAAPGAAGVGTTSAEGTATSLARSDHTHQSNTAPVNVTKAAAAIGTSTEPARADHKHDISTAAATTGNIGDAAAEGTSTSLSRADHVHAFTAPAAPVNVTKATADAGAATTFARSDHKHDITTAAPSTIGTANSEGTATSLSRSDHTHNHGAQTSGTLHAAATTSVAGFMSAADKTILDGLSAGAGGVNLYGANNISAGADTRYLTPGYDTTTAGLTAIGWIATRPGTMKNMRVRHNAAAGNGNNVVYTLVVNGVASTLTVTLATNAVGNGSDTTHSVSIAAGDRIEVTAAKAATIGSGTQVVMLSIEFGA